MPTKTIEEQRKALFEKEAKLKLEMKALRTREREELKSMRDRGLIILGGLVKAEAEARGELHRLCARVTRPADVATLDALGWTATPPAPAPAAAPVRAPVQIRSALMGETQAAAPARVPVKISPDEMVSRFGPSRG